MTTASAPGEFSRMMDLRQIPAAPVQLAASPTECAALAARFGLIAVERLEATVSLVADGAMVTATGQMCAAWTQPCAVSGEDLPQAIAEPLALRFVPAAPTAPDAEIELSEAQLDEIEYNGTSFDLGEAVAQSLGLAIDPFACGPEAEAARQAAGITSEAAAGAFGALAGLKFKE